MCNVDDIIKLLSDVGININKNDIGYFSIKDKLCSDNKKIVLDEVPEERGVYFVVYSDYNQLTIDKDCRIFKEENCPSKTDQTRYSTIKLTEKLKKYNNESERNNILYIGKAEPKKGLRQRIKQYLQTGKNKHGNHNGGKAIWQFENIDNLILCYISEDNLSENHTKTIIISTIETALLVKFKEIYGTYPLANWRK
jgi:hypothetical protein